MKDYTDIIQVLLTGRGYTQSLYRQFWLKRKKMSTSSQHTDFFAADENEKPKSEKKDFFSFSSLIY